MKPISIVLLLLSAATAAVAAPSPTSPDVHYAVIEKRAVCTPASLGNDQEDDTPAIKAAIATCGNGGTIVLPAGKTFSVRSLLDFTGCVNCDFQLEGTLKASDDTTFWATQPAIIQLNKINGAKFRSLTGTGVIDGNGQTAYDQFAANSSLVRATTVFISGGSNILFSGFSMKNPPNVFFSQKGSVTNIEYSSLTMTAASKSTNAPKNTDGFDIGQSTFTTITDVSVTNQDDCIAFKSGANFVTVSGVTCAGTTHGVSVGSLGETNADFVSNVIVTDLTMIDCSKAVGIKLYPGGPTHGTATVTNVTWDGVTVNNCDYGAQIQSCYNSDVSVCEATPSKAVLEQIFFKNFKGTTSTTEAPVTANLDCPAAGTCDLSFTDWAVVTAKGTSEVLCNNIDGNPGITCVSGASG